MADHSALRYRPRWLCCCPLLLRPAVHPRRSEGHEQASPDRHTLPRLALATGGAADQSRHRGRRTGLQARCCLNAASGVPCAVMAGAWDCTAHLGRIDGLSSTPILGFRVVDHARRLAAGDSLAAKE